MDPETLALTREPTHLESALPPELARRVVEQALSLTRRVRARLTVEGKGGSASLELPLRVDPGAAPGFRLATPRNAEGIEFVLDSQPDGRGTLRFNVRYAGRRVERALLYARFVRALYWEEGTLYLTPLKPRGERLELFDLPLPLDAAGKGDAEARVRFLEILDEICKATGTELIHPSEINDDDLRNIEYVFKVIQGGWVTLAVTDFTTPMGSEGVKNILDLVAQEDEVLRAFAMTAQGERRQIFDTWVDLGPLVYYVSGARLVTPRSEMEQWLASDLQSNDSFDVRWEPVDDALVHVLYLLAYSYKYITPSGLSIRYDMHEEEFSGHPKRHLQISALGEDVRLPTGVDPNYSESKAVEYYIDMLWLRALRRAGCSGGWFWDQHGRGTAG